MNKKRAQSDTDLMWTVVGIVLFVGIAIFQIINHVHKDHVQAAQNAARIAQYEACVRQASYYLNQVNYYVSIPADAQLSEMYANDYVAAMNQCKEQY